MTCVTPKNKNKNSLASIRTSGFTADRRSIMSLPKTKKDKKAGGRLHAGVGHPAPVWLLRARLLLPVLLGMALTALGRTFGAAGANCGDEKHKCHHTNNDPDVVFQAARVLVQPRHGAAENIAVKKKTTSQKPDSCRTRASSRPCPTHSKNFLAIS
jgi:hypothetical protein